MPVITAIKQQLRRPERVSVYIDGKYRLSLHQSELNDSGITQGQEVSATQLEQLLVRAVQDKALLAAFNQLSFRPRSTSELRQHLARKGFDDDQIDLALERLQQDGLVDDAAFAAEWAASRQQQGLKSRFRLQQELRQKGISQSDAEMALSSLEDEVQIIASLIERRSLRHRYPDGRALTSYLQSQGFKYDDIKTALKES